MEKKQVVPMTPFDELVTSPQLQAIKLLLPYAPVSEQRLLAAFIKFQEFRQTIRLFSRLRRGLGAQLFQGGNDERCFRRRRPPCGSDRPDDGDALTRTEGNVQHI